MKLQVKAGTTSKLVRIFVPNSTLSTGVGLTGLAYNTASLTAYYIKEGDASATEITLADMTVGTWASGGFKEIDATNMPGWYEVGLPNAAIASSASVGIHFQGAANMAPVPIEIELVSYNPLDTIRLGLTSLPNAAADAAGGIPISDAGELDLDNMCNNALVALKLDHLLAVADADDVVDNSVIAKLADRAFGTADWSNFDNTTDSLRAIRDRGDQAWLTGVGSEGSESYVTTSWARTVGDNDGGVGSDTATVDGSYFSTGETGAGTYLEVDAVFATSAGQQGRTLNMWGFYSGGGSHYIEIKAYNYNDSTWEPIGIIGSDTVVAKHSFNLTPDQTKADGEISIKFLHGGGSGVVSHVLSIDKCEVNTSIPSTGDVNITQWDGNAVTGDGDWAELQGNIDLLNITLQAMSVTLDSVDGKVDTLDTVADAIKAKTDNLPQGIKKNTAYPDFLFTMVDSTDSVTPKTGLAVTAKRNIDGAGFLACANAVVEVGDGWYIIDLADTDLNGNSIALQFTASGAGMTTFTLKTET